MEARAHLKYARIAPRKVPVVLDLIRDETLTTPWRFCSTPRRPPPSTLTSWSSPRPPTRKTTTTWIRTTCTSPSASSARTDAEAVSPRAGPCVPYLKENDAYHRRAQRERVRRKNSMGQKVNPHGLRVGVIKDWDCRWFTSKRIRRHPGGRLQAPQIAEKEPLRRRRAENRDRAHDRQPDEQPRVRVTIHCSKPGMVIGKGGAEKEKLQASSPR